ncbi:hypothetical protein PBV87_12635 [Niameybacter massiliensis]|uniref:Uncharacterized protein n=1 Tax=Holtiella tumoricola TaxID=3018743 RepID=A0AA42J1C7_9FIRM|nr:hypothetical protein [Holtiella tumoricola]MDA3732334.1 hypothetical protein [Holtiella tumoricola]
MVKQLYNALKFPRSTYYNTLISKPSKKQLKYETFRQKVIDKFNQYRQPYRAVKLQKVLSRGRY